VTTLLSFSKILPPFVPPFLKKIVLLLPIAGSSSGIYKQRRRGSPYPCHGAG